MAASESETDGKIPAATHQGEKVWPGCPTLPNSRDSRDDSHDHSKETDPESPSFAAILADAVTHVATASRPWRSKVCIARDHAFAALSHDCFPEISDGDDSGPDDSDGADDLTEDGKEAMTDDSKKNAQKNGPQHHLQEKTKDESNDAPKKNTNNRRSGILNATDTSDNTPPSSPLSPDVTPLSQASETNGVAKIQIGTDSRQWGRPSMEDRFVIKTTLGPRHPNAMLVGVFDGHNGVGAAEFLRLHIPIRCQELKCLSDAKEIQNMIQKLDVEFESSEWFGGSTVLIALIEPETAKSFRVTIAHLGDSRAIVFSKTMLKAPRFFATEDHTPKREEKALVARSGQSDPVRNNRVDGELGVGRAFGNWGAAWKSWLVPTPDVVTVQCSENELLLLCSDGMFQNPQITNSLLAAKVAGLYQRRIQCNEKNQDHLSKICQRIAAFAAKDIRRSDNITALLIDFFPHD